MMHEFRPVLAGLIAAFLSGFLVIGSLYLALSEGGVRLARLPEPTASATATLEPSRPLPTIDQSTQSILAQTPSQTPSPTVTLQPSATSTDSCSYPPGWEELVLQIDDDLEAIADQYGISLEELMQANCMRVLSFSAGSALRVPPLPTSTPKPRATRTHTPTPVCVPPLNVNWVAYIIQRGDTLYALSVRYQTTIQEIMRVNCMDRSELTAGNNLYLPYRLTSTPTEVPPPTRTATQPPSPTPSATITEAPTATNTPEPLPEPSDTLTPTETSTDTPTATVTPADTKTPTPETNLILGT